MVAIFALGKTRVPAHIQFGLGLAATGYAPDISSRLFAPQFETGMRSSMSSVLAELDDHPFGISTPTREITQDALLLEMEANHDYGDAWSVRVSWDGGVAIYWSMAVEQTSIPSVVERPLKAAWACADELLGELQPQGPRYLEITVAGGAFPVGPAAVSLPGEPRPNPPTIMRGPLAPGVDHDTLASIERELRRAAGEPAFES